MPITPDASPLIQRGMQPRRTLVIGLLAATLVAVALLLFSHLSAQAQVQDGRGALTGLTLTSDTPRELVIAWDQANPEPTDYRVNWAREGEDFPIWGDTSGNSLPAGESQTLTGLDEGGTYKVRVRARYHQGQYEADPWSRPWVQRSQQVASTPETTPEPTSQPSQEDPPQEDPPRVQQNDKDSGAKSKDRVEGSSDLDDSDDTCPDADNAPEPTAVAVEAVPIVVASTTAEYFVLYALYELDTETTVELPVLVKRGAAGTTTLAENVAALPKERYRVEQYLIADPGDVDGDCTDDVTELDSLGRMNPVNPAAAIDFKDGLVAVPDRATFDALAARQRFLKFIIFDIDTDRPGIYFINTTTHTLHNTFLDTVGLKRSEVILGHMVYQAELVAPDGSRGVYYYWGVGPSEPFSSAARTYTVTAAGMPLLNDNLAFYLVSGALPFLQSDLPSYRASRINLVFTEDISVGIRYAALNPGEGYGRLRVMGPGQRPNPRDIVLYEALPNELPRVAGILSTVLQTPLSHVNLRAVQDAIPNAFVRGALDDSSIASLVDSYVHYEVTEEWYSIRAATKAEVDAHYASSRPTRPQTPQRDLSVREITPLSEIGFDDWEAFGVKAANVAVLGTLGFPEGTVPDGFAIPFYFYDEFMKHNKFYTRIQTMLDGEEFRTNFDTQEAKLKKLRKDIEDAETPQWIIEALTTMNESFAQGVNRRYRSSTNNEDLPGFSGAGLYDSKSQKPSEDGKDLAKSLKEVYASLWNFRAFIERDFNRIDHLAAAMGILVHPSYQDELVNGVAVSFDPFSSRDDNYYYVNSQVGEDLVTNPEPHSVPEEILLEEGGRYNVLATSNLVKPGKLLMSAAQVSQLREHLEVIHDHFKGLYNPGPGEQFAMEIEFKITSDNILAIKQARPWVFGTASSTPSPPTITTTSSSATGLRQPENRTSRLYTYRATDPEGGTITWSVGGIDGQVFTIDEQGQFSFKETSPPNFEIPGDSGRDNIYDVTVQARDDQSNTATLPVMVTVTDVNEGPEIRRVGSAPGGVAENQDQMQVLARYAATDPEDTSAQITLWSTSGTDGGDFVINEQGELRFRYSPDYERPADSNRDNIYEVTVRASDGRYYGTFEETVTVTPVNGPPTITTTSSSATRLRQPENRTSRLYTYRATDPEGSSITWSVGGTDGGFFTIDERGQFSFNETSPPDFEMPGDSGGDNVYDVTVQASDGAHTESVAVMVNVTDVNEGPEISGTQTLGFDENRATDQVLARYTGRDPENPGTPINRWSTSGTDGGDFTINEDGELTFRNVPDYERPADSNRDNIYTFSVRAYDGRYYGYHEVTVAVDDLDEITGSSTLDRSENFEGLLATYSATGLGGLTVVPAWRLTGTDGGDFSISEQGELTFRSRPDYERPADSNRDNVYNFDVQVSDGGYYGSHDVTVRVTPVNEPPTITTTNSSATGLRQPENRISTLYTYRATDPEGGTVTWSAAGPDGGDFTIVGGALRFGTEPDFESPTGANGNEYRVTVRAEDAQGNPDTLEVTVTVTAVDEGPEVTGGGNSFTVQENQEWTGASFRASDPEGGTVARWRLAGRDGGDFAISETGLMTFRNVPDYERPADSNRDNIYEVTVRPYDGRNYGSHDVTVTVTPVNEAPSITTTGRTSFTQPENRISTLYTFRATDPEGGTVAWSAAGPDGGDFTIVGGALRFGTEPDFESPTGANGNEYRVTVRAEDAQGNPDTLEVTVTVTAVDEGPEVTSGGNSFTVQESQEWTGASFTASDPEGGTVSRWRLAGRDGGDFAISETGLMTFRNIPDYERPADSNRDNLYEVTVQPYDGRNYGSHDVTVTVTPVNEPPSITTTSRTSFTQPENRISTLYTFRATDPEGGTVTWSATGPDGGDFTIVGGALRFGTEPDFESPAGANGNEYRVTVRAEDAQGNPDTLEVTVTVTAVDEGPEVTSGGSSFTVQENQEWTGASFRASDPEGGTVSRWRLAGRDGGDFTISETGLMTFRNVPDYERPADSNRDNLYEVTVRPYDGRNYGSHDVRVMVTPVNEPPTITTTSRTSFTQPENRISTLYTFRATDPEGGDFEWDLAGPDAGVFSISETGVLSFSSPPDFESPTGANGNEYQVTVQARDQQSNMSNLPVTVTVTDQNEGPEIRRLGNEPGSVPENQEQMQVLARYSATDPEDTSAQITLWRTSGTDGGDFVINEQGELRFRNSPDHERPADSNRDNVYEVSIRASDGRNYGTFEDTEMVRVTNVNEAPVITTKSRTGFTQRENATSALHTYRATDPDRDDAITWSVEGSDRDDFAIYDGILTFRLLPDYEIPADSNGDNEYEITVVASDSGNLRDTVDATITITEVNEGPEITPTHTNTQLTIQEYTDPTLDPQNQILATYSATDPEGDAVTRWSLSGSDGGDFEISGTGVLTFRNVPDYDRPADSNRDNEYLVSIRVYDAGNRYGSLDVTVTVTDVNEEAPVVTGSDNRTVSENSTSAIHTYRATDADLDDTIAWSTSGADGHLFEMSVQGALSFREAPDYENPGDSDRNNVYELEVVATDSEGLTGELMVTITVTEVNEGPEITGTPTYTIQEFHQSLANATYSATDPEGDSISRWRLSGSDGGDFTITDTSELTGRNTADLSFRYPPDVDRPADSNRDNEYLVTIRAYDNRGRYGSYDVTVIVTAANEPPVITGSDARTFRENGTGTIHTYRATDPEGDAFSWIAPSGTDGHLFDISDRGALTFRTPPDFDIEGDANRDNDYRVTVQARDDSFSTGAFDVTVTVTDVNEGPEVSGRETMTVQEYTDPTQDPALQTLATYSARDPEGSDISRWSLSGSDGGDFSINENGELTFRYAPDYDRPVDSNRDNEYLVSVRAYDETNRYGSLDVTVTVRGENEADPVVTGSQSLSFRENTAVTTRLYTYRATDTDRDTIIVWSVRGQDGSDFDIDSDDGVLTFKEAPDYEIPADSDTNNEYLVTVVATDDEGREGTLDVVVTVTEVPEGPEITAPSGQTEFTYDENVDRVVATLTARDPEEPASGIARWSLAGSDGGDLTITDTSQQTGRNTAQLTFRNTPDYERPADSNRDNEYLVTIRAYDQGNRYGSLDVKIAVIDENEHAPVVTGSQALSFQENTATTTRLHTYRARDMDRGAATTWSLEGDDQGDFAIDEGVLTFNEEPDYEDPADVNDDNEYEITVVASDGTNRGNLDVSIMVTEVNEGPEITGPATRTVAENFEDMVATYTGEDPEDTAADINRWSVTGRDGGDFTINEGGELTFRNPPDFERPADANRDNEYEVTVRASDGRHYGTYDVTVTVEAVNEAPEFRSGSRTSFTHRENGTSDLYTYRATDPEGDEFTWEVGGTDGGAFEISEDGGVLAFKIPPDFENPGDFDGDNEYLVTVVVRDDQSNMSELEVLVSVTELNEGPEIQETPANTDITVSENSEGVLFDYSATDPEDPDAEITRWSVTGTDGGDFTINEDGELSFRNVPDFERPVDSNRDNEYLVTVRASDGRYNGTLEVTVRVEAVNERPEFRGGSTATFAYQENGTSDLYTYRATDPEGNDVAWGLSGTDRGAFEISETGVLSFIDPPDYESPTDSGSNNVYEVTVEAGDGDGNTAGLEVTVTVTNLTDRLPVITGTAQVGRTLRADTSDIDDDDGQARVSYSYQWIRNEGKTDTDIDGETDPTYTPSDSDVGKTLKVRVLFADDARNQKALTSAATAAVAAADNRAATGLPTISGTVQLDETLTADTSGIADEDGLTNVSYSYQWISGGSDIDGATGSTYTLTASEQGQTIQVRVSFTDDRNNAETLTSEATGAVAAADNRAATGLPTIGDGAGGGDADGGHDGHRR